MKKVKLKDVKEGDIVIGINEMGDKWIIKIIDSKNKDITYRVLWATYKITDKIESHKILKNFKYDWTSVQHYLLTEQEAFMEML